MQKFLLAATLVLIGCAENHQNSEYWTASTSRYTNSKYSMSLGVLLHRIEAGDKSAWTEFKNAGSGVDGERSQVFSVACSELLRRDPTFTLRRYLKGDDEAITYSRRGYMWSARHEKGRALMDEIYARRIYIATSEPERIRIKQFIMETTQAG